MNCQGCKRRRAGIAAWFRRLFGREQPKTGVEKALELANELRDHCERYGISGTFAGVTVPAQRKYDEPTSPNR